MDGWMDNILDRSVDLVRTFILLFHSKSLVLQEPTVYSSVYPLCSFTLAVWGSALPSLRNCCAAGWWQAKAERTLFQHVISCYWESNIIVFPPCSNLETNQYSALFIKVTAPGYCILHFYVFFCKRVLKHNISEVLALWADKEWGGTLNDVKQLRNGCCSCSYTRSYKYPLLIHCKHQSLPN